MDQYLLKQSVHKDFHHVLSLIIDYLKNNYGKTGMNTIIKKAALDVYRPLIEDLKKQNLSVIKKHVSDVMKLEGGEYEIVDGQNSITISIKKCPAIDYMKRNNLKISSDFCHASTELVGKAIVESAGYKFSLDYDLCNGKCIQRFWKE